ncbi:hypothetical protein [Rhodoglobus vestalii]|uniref:hypothetical protein n=1 Tax=Rhodoglobus vestalii TaxID=193384 RepID=UPI001C01781E|nr:hypothetical protein [Rhodoglobus vestalii]
MPIAISRSRHTGWRPEPAARLRYWADDFLSAYAVRLDADTGELTTAEIAAFITPKALITVRKDDSFPIDALLDHLD